jgi:hypothetical protein
LRPAAMVIRTRTIRTWMAFPVSLASVWLIWCVVVVTHGLVTPDPNYPVNGLWNGAVWVRDAHWYAVHDTLPKIPAGQCVESDNQIAPQLTNRDYVTRVTQAQGLATWVVLDMTMKETGWQMPAPAVALTIEQQRGYRIVSWQWPIVLMHKDRSIVPLCRGLF